MSDENDTQVAGDGTFTIPEVEIRPYPTIRKGDRGPTVAKWQRMIGVTADGNFGSQTDSVTRTWQGAHGITPDGVVGIKTWAKMLESTTPVGMLALEWNQPSPEIPAPPAPASVIPPVAGAVPLPTSAPPAVTFAKPPAITSATMGGGVFDFLGKLPTWGKWVLGLGVGAAVVSQASAAGKSGRGKHG